MDGSAAEVFKRCGSAFRAEGWKALEELGAVGGGLVGGLCGLLVLQGLGLGYTRIVPRGAPRAGKPALLFGQGIVGEVAALHRR